MKEFNLEAAKHGAELYTRFGNKVYGVEITDQCIKGKIMLPSGEEWPYIWLLSGSLSVGDNKNLDLMIGDDTDAFLETALDPKIQKMNAEHEQDPAVNHPDYYRYADMECIDAMLAAFTVEEVDAFCRLNAFKYIWRAGRKDDKYQDVRKAIWYLNYAVELHDRVDNAG